MGGLVSKGTCFIGTFTPCKIKLNSRGNDFAKGLSKEGLGMGGFWGGAS